jgi:hypothetical protein
METSQNLLNNDLQVDSRIAGHLKETAGWAKFLGIMGFILAVLMAIIAFVVPEFMNRYRSYESYDYSGNSKIVGVAITVAYLFIAAIMFFVALFTFKFGSKTREALAMNDQVSLDTGLKNLKFLFRFYGIVAIIYLGILVLALLFGGLAMAFH